MASPKEDRRAPTPLASAPGAEREATSGMRVHQSNPPEAVTESGTPCDGRGPQGHKGPKEEPSEAGPARAGPYGRATTRREGRTCLGRRLASPRGLDNAALVRIHGPEGKARLAMAQEPPAFWGDWTRAVEEVLNDPRRGVTNGGQAVYRNASLRPKPERMILASMPELPRLAAGSGAAPTSPPWRLWSMGLAMRRPRYIAAWAPKRWRPLPRRQSSGAGGRRRRPPAGLVLGSVSRGGCSGPAPSSSSGLKARRRSRAYRDQARR